MKTLLVFSALLVAVAALDITRPPVDAKPRVAPNIVDSFSAKFVVRTAGVKLGMGEWIVDREAGHESFSIVGNDSVTMHRVRRGDLQRTFNVRNGQCDAEASATHMWSIWGWSIVSHYEGHVMRAGQQLNVWGIDVGVTARMVAVSEADANTPEFFITRDPQGVETMYDFYEFAPLTRGIAGAFDVPQLCGMNAVVANAGQPQPSGCTRHYFASNGTVEGQPQTTCDNDVAQCINQSHNLELFCNCFHKGNNEWGCAFNKFCGHD